MFISSFEVICKSKWKCFNKKQKLESKPVRIHVHLSREYSKKFHCNLVSNFEIKIQLKLKFHHIPECRNENIAIVAIVRAQRFANKISNAIAYGENLIFQFIDTVLSICIQMLSKIAT